MGQMTRGSLPRLMQEGLAGVFGQSYAEHPMEYNQIFEVRNTGKAYEVLQEIDALSPAVVKDEGAALSYDSFGQSFNPKFVPVTYAKGISCSDELIEDELYGVLANKAKALGFSMTQAKEIYAANVISRAFNTSYTMSGGDALPLCSASHVSGPSGGTYSNKLSVAAALTESSLEDLLIQVRNATDSRGNKIAIKATQLIVTPTNMFNAYRITQSVLRSGTAENDTNAMKGMGAIPKTFVSSYATDSTAWGIQTNCADGLIFFQRRAVRFEEDNSFNTGAMRYKGSERFAAGWGNPRGYYGSDAA